MTVASACRRDGTQLFEGKIAFAALNTADVTAVNDSAISEIFLRPTRAPCVRAESCRLKFVASDS
jgi:hypothetical protein